MTSNWESIDHQSIYRRDDATLIELLMIGLTDCFFCWIMGPDYCAELRDKIVEYEVYTNHCYYADCSG